jgi:hypothetical protein
MAQFILTLFLVTRRPSDVCFSISFESASDEPAFVSEAQPVEVSSSEWNLSLSIRPQPATTQAAQSKRHNFFIVIAIIVIFPHNKRHFEGNTARGQKTKETNPCELVSLCITVPNYRTFVEGFLAVEDFCRWLEEWA